ncbi:hypothetical protein CGRA01v4_01861 [Colletotrichum graminicola]|nr:hypothetical protein CGRA01v4_01861 [Colletotrichum graminicola]
MQRQCEAATQPFHALFPFDTLTHLLEACHSTPPCMGLHLHYARLISSRPPSISKPPRPPDFTSLAPTEPRVDPRGQSCCSQTNPQMLTVDVLRVPTCRYLGT